MTSAPEAAWHQPRNPAGGQPLAMGLAQQLAAVPLPRRLCQQALEPAPTTSPPLVAATVALGLVSPLRRGVGEAEGCPRDAAPAGWVLPVAPATSSTAHSSSEVPRPLGLAEQWARAAPAHFQGPELDEAILAVGKLLKLQRPIQLSDWARAFAVALEGPKERHGRLRLLLMAHGWCDRRWVELPHIQELFKDLVDCEGKDIAEVTAAALWREEAPPWQPHWREEAGSGRPAREEDEDEEELEEGVYRL